MVVEIPYKDAKVRINVDEYNKCMDEKDEQTEQLVKDIPGGSAFVEGARIDSMAGCIDFNNVNK